MSVAFIHAATFHSLGWPLLVIAALIGVSRVRLGAHYPGDVLVGQLIAIATGAMVVSLRLAIFTDTYPPQINGVAPTLARLVKAVEARGGAVQVVTVSDPDATSDPQVERWPSIPFWAYPQLQMAAPQRDKALDLI